MEEKEENSVEFIQTKTLPISSFYEHFEATTGSRIASSTTLSKFNSEY